MWKAIKSMCRAIWTSLTSAVDMAGKYVVFSLISLWLIGAVVVYGAKMDLWPMPEVKYDPVITYNWVIQKKEGVIPTQYLPTPSSWWRPDDPDNTIQGKFTLKIGSDQPVGFNSIDELNKELLKYGREVVAVEVKSSPPYFKVGFKVTVQLVGTLWGLLVGFLESVWELLKVIWVEIHTNI